MTYRLTPGTLLHEVVGEKILMTSEKGVVDFSKMFRLNAPGTVLAEALAQRPCTVAQLVEGLTARFEVDEALAERDTAEWLGQLVALQLVEQTED